MPKNCNRPILTRKKWCVIMRVSNRFDKRLFFVYNKEDRMSRERASCAKMDGMEKFTPSLQKHTFRHICGVDVKLFQCGHSRSVLRRARGGTARMLGLCIGADCRTIILRRKKRLKPDGKPNCIIWLKYVPESILAMSLIKIKKENYQIKTEEFGMKRILITKQNIGAKIEFSIPMTA